MKRILVTGAGGFVGRHVTPLLTAAGLDVHAVSSRDRSGAGDCTWHRADLLDPAEREALIRDTRPDSLLHLAWEATPPAYWRSPENLRWLTASLDLIRLFAEHGGSRIVGVGSCAEYDWTFGYCTERMTPLAPSSLYGTTKAACGSVFEAYARETGLSAAWARLFFLFGPFDSPVRLVPSLVRTLAAGAPARCTAGAHVRDFLHVSDAASALAALLQSDVSGPVNIASGAPVRVGDLARRIADRLGCPALLTVDEGPRDGALVCANIGRLRDEVRFSPRLDTLTALDETIEWWRSPAAAQVTA